MPPALFRRRLSLLLLLAFMAENGGDAAFVTYDMVRGQPYAVGMDARSFTINGTATLLLGGSFHPPRVAHGDWPRLLQQAREDGLNHVQIYVFWNFHEQERGQRDFTKGTRRDLAGFFQAAASAGLFVNVRIGPYVCAEWNGGGFPLWLKNVTNFTCARCSDPVWEAEMGGFVRAVADIMRPYLARVGGPIIMAQIENELHSRRGDPYVAWCGELAASLNLDIPWVMCNGASANNTVNTCNGNTCGADGGYADLHAAQFPGQPLGWTEDWSWFATWGQPVTNHPGPYMANNVAIWFAKGGSHHNYYMYYGGNHIGSWAASGLTNRYGDGSNLHSDTLRNEPKRSHLAALHRALAAMNDMLLGAPIQTRALAASVSPCPAEARSAGRPVCVNGTNGTGVVPCDPSSRGQKFIWTGNGVNATGLLMFRGASGGTTANHMCVDGTCDLLGSVGCVPLPLVPCNPSAPGQLWQMKTAPGLATTTQQLVSAASGGCLASWSQRAVPNDRNTYPLAGVYNCSTGWGAGVFNWSPDNGTGTLYNGLPDRPSPLCLSASHPAVSPVLAYEYVVSGAQGTGGKRLAGFVQNTLNEDVNVTYHGTTLQLPAGSISLVLQSEENGRLEVLFNTESVNATSVPCNRTFTPLAPLSAWSSWPEPVPPVGGMTVHTPAPHEQLALTLDRTDYMYYSFVLPATPPATQATNLTLSTIEANGFVLFLDGQYAGAVDDHSKGPDPRQLSLPVPVSPSSREATLLSVSLGIQNFHGTNPLSFRKGILGDVMWGVTNITAARGGWSSRPFLGGQLQPFSDIPWLPMPAATTRTAGRAMTWYQVTFPDPRPDLCAECALLLDAAGLGRGHFYINGKDLGRVWPLIGGEAARYYYIPLDTLRASGQNNTLEVFDELGAPRVGSVALVSSRMALPVGGVACPV